MDLLEEKIAKIHYSVQILFKIKYIRQGCNTACGRRTRNRYTGWSGLTVSSSVVESEYIHVCVEVRPRLVS